MKWFVDHEINRYDITKLKVFLSVCTIMLSFYHYWSRWFPTHHRNSPDNFILIMWLNLRSPGIHTERFVPLQMGGAQTGLTHEKWEIHHQYRHGPWRGIHQPTVDSWRVFPQRKERIPAHHHGGKLDASSQPRWHSFVYH